jgi:PAS domain S-box-containing protein
MRNQTQLDEAANRYADIKDMVRNYDENNHQIPLLEGIPGYAALFLDKNGQITSWTMGARRMTGYTKQEIIRQPFSCFYTQEDATLPAFELAVAARKNFYNKEHWMVRKNGSRFWARIYIFMVSLENDIKADGFLVIFWDLTRVSSKERAFSSCKTYPLDQN